MRGIDSNQPTQKAIYFWNTLGGLLNAAFSVAIMIILTRIAGVHVAGIFSLGYSNAMMLQHVGSFDSRSYQCSTFDKRMSFSAFLTFRLFTSLLMFVATLVLIFIFQYKTDKALATLFLSMFCIAANISDIYQGNAQKVGRLDLAGKSLSLRIIICIVVFWVILILTHNNLNSSVAGITVLSFLWILFFDKKYLVFGEKISYKISYTQFKQLFINTLPLFLSLFSEVFIFNMPKYAMDAYMSIDYQAIYGILFMPASIVSLFATFLYRPVMVKLSLEWNSGKYKNIIKICYKRIILMIIAMILIVFAGGLCGCQVLTLVYGTNVIAYKKEFVILLIGGGFAGVSVLLYYLMTIVRKQYIMVAIHFIVLVLSGFINYRFVEKLGVLGAAIGYLVALVILDIILLCTLIIIFYKKRKG